MFWSNKVGLEQEMEEMTGVGKERERANKKKKKKKRITSCRRMTRQQTQEWRTNKTEEN